MLTVRQFQTSEKMTPALFLKAQTHVMQHEGNQNPQHIANIFKNQDEFKLD